MAFALSLDQFKQTMPTLGPKRAALYYNFLLQAMDEFEINTKLRVAAFLAQIGHESVDLLHMVELWGPTAQQKKYERPLVDGKLQEPAPNRLDVKPYLWQRLGNVKTGDGYMFRGRSPIHLTGRGNYEKYGRKLGVDLVLNPPLAERASIGFRIAGLYWHERNLNLLADTRDFDAITLRVNGGYTHKEQRDARFSRALRVVEYTEVGLA